ncbi:hypothetical protein N7533_011074 [Penicillium manginii]|jgi:hypothetical protein|uniref:uncharacterized protein n=1 Tax=Penicillium manginii TaxID=203109 RepID=UPI002547A899|nr:uncharacterized protein N7533_011074 [Penicillium manginii]KAJ5741665.1 hypothetical protein N7533_011074 [Penicillium manginii]
MSIATKAKKAADLFEQWRERSLLLSTELEYAENQLFRFNLWTSNNYIFESPRASMDWRLRNAPLLQSAMNDLLEDLILNLIGQSISPFTQSFMLINSQESQNTPRQTEELLTGNPTAAPNVEDTLDQLFRFSRAVRRSGMLHRLVKIANHTEYGPDGVNLTSKFHMATSRIIDHYLKGCNASQELRERLVDTICLRQRNFSYLKSQKKTRSVPMQVSEQLPSGARSTFAPSFSVMTPVTRTGHKEKSIQFKPRLDLRRSLLTATTAQIDHVPLDRSIQSSIAAPQPDVSDEDPELPRPPVVPFGRKEWECPYCLVVCPVKEFRPENWR